MRELEYPFDSQWILKKKKSIKKQLLSEDKDYISKRIAILGGSTTNDIKLVLELFLLNYNIKPEFYESEFNQYYEDVMFENEGLLAFQPDLIYIHTSSKNISVFPTMDDTKEDIEGKIEAEYEKFQGMWDKIEETYKCQVIQNNFEMVSYRLLGNADTYLLQGKKYYVQQLNQKFYEYAREHEKFHIQDIEYLSACYGLDQWADSFYWHMYKYALNVNAIPDLCFNLANIIKSILGKNKKVLALDLDNTLWHGVVGDDGVDQIEIGMETGLGQVYLEFQQYLKEVKDLGVLLTVISKNDYENAIAGINHKEGALREADFVAIKANWERKDSNLLELADELNLLPESFVFVDDNPVEREIVKEQVSGVGVPPMEKAEEYRRILDKSGFFETTCISSDDKNRNQMYQENRQRSIQQAKFADYEEYLLSLEMTGIIKEFDASSFSRIAQLTNKSNQFNLTTVRYTQAELEEIASDENYITLYGKLIDKFGNNGIVSVLFGKIGEETADENGDVKVNKAAEKCLHIGLFLMSCRVLKRQMEQAMMDELILECRNQGIKKIYGYYFKTAKNSMVSDLYETFGFELLEALENGDKTYQYKIDTKRENQNKVIKVVKHE